MADTCTIEPKRVFVTDENGLQNEFKSVHVTFYSYRDTGGWASEGRTVNLLPADSSSFVAAGSVTKEQLISWVEAALGAEELAAIEAKLSADIDTMVANNPPYFHDVEVENPVPINHVDATAAWQPTQTPE